MKESLIISSATFLCQLPELGADAAVDETCALSRRLWLSVRERERELDSAVGLEGTESKEGEVLARDGVGGAKVATESFGMLLGCASLNLTRVTLPLC